MAKVESRLSGEQKLICPVAKYCSAAANCPVAQEATDLSGWRSFLGKDVDVLKEQDRDLRYWGARMSHKLRPLINGKGPQGGVCPVQFDTRNVNHFLAVVKEKWEQ